VASCYEHDNEPSGSMKGGYFLDQLRYCQIFKKDSAQWSWSLNKSNTANCNLKVKIKVSLCLTKHHVVKEY
jgi:hypothetical protein